MGPLFIDLLGTTLTAEERELIAHPLVGGVILFSRNYQHRRQLQQLVADIRRASCEQRLIAVDHEGGRVQRFRDGFTRLPAIAALGRVAQTAAQACHFAREMGWLMAAELRAVDIDLSFAPVLDLDAGSDVIGDRAFSSEPARVSALAAAYIQGMHDAGMAATGKHFPGHGSVKADSHLAAPVDERPWEVIRQRDLVPFSGLIAAGLMDAVMPAHVTYPAIDPACPAGFSAIWLQRILRQQLGFRGLIFSDDLSMEGAGLVGGYGQRAEAALAAGCDFLLACNNRRGTEAILDQLSPTLRVTGGARLAGRADGEANVSAVRGQQARELAKRLTAAAS